MTRRGVQVSTYEHPLDNHFRAYYHAMAAQAAQKRMQEARDAAAASKAAAAVGSHLPTRLVSQSKLAHAESRRESRH